MIKYQNVLNCEKEFKQICDDSDKIVNNAENIKLSINKIESEYTSKIMAVVQDANEREIKQVDG